MLSEGWEAEHGQVLAHSALPQVYSLVSERKDTPLLQLWKNDVFGQQEGDSWCHPTHPPLLNRTY